MPDKKLLSQKLLYNQYIKPHFIALNSIVSHKIDIADLINISDTINLREKAQELQHKPLYEFEIPFTEKKTIKFDNFLQALHEQNDQPVLVWIKHTIDCGAYKMNSILDLNTQFSFTDPPGDIVVFVTNDNKDKLLLDCYVNQDGEEMLLIEIQGDNWINSARDFT